MLRAAAVEVLEGGKTTELLPAEEETTGVGRGRR